MSETPTVRGHLMALADLFDEPQHFNAPDAEACSAADRPEAWTELSLGWSRVVAAARVIQSRHSEDSQGDVLSQCADAAREAAVSELRWVWARMVNKFVGGGWSRMLEDEPPLTTGERLTIVSLYARLTVSQNRTVPGRLAAETPCYADLNISSPRTLSHKEIPAIRVAEGSGTC